jgi:hypothetical protein
MKRYAIIGTEYLAGDKEVVICELGSNPEAAIEALKEKKLHVYKGPGATRKSTIGRYVKLRIEDRQA